MRRTTAIFAALALASCGPIQSAQVQDQINGMVGLSKEHVLSCMGPPSNTAKTVATEVWTYNSFGPVNTSTFVSANQSFAVGSTSTNQEFCVVNLTMQGDRVTAANYRSQGKLLSPSLPCYNVLHVCVPNPVSTTAQTEKNQAAAAYCKQLYTDQRLNPVRGVIALDEQPTLAMQSNPVRVTDEQRAALDVFKSLSDQCRAKIATDNPRVFQIMEQINPDPHAKLMMLYQRQITIGEYNIYRQQMSDKFRAAVAASAQ